jgi:hypothetical protein
MAKVRMLSREDIFAAQDIEERVVLVPQWKGAVKIRTFSKEVLDKMRKDSTGPNPGKIGRPIELDQEEFEARIFINGVIDPVFTLEDYAEIQKKSAVALSVILKAIIEANGLSEAAVAEADKSAATGLDAPLRILPGPGVEDDAAGVADPNVS